MKLLARAGTGLFAILSITSASACSSSLDINLLTDGTARIRSEARFETHFIRVLSNLSGAGNELILDAPGISSTLQKAPGIASAAFTSPAPNKIQGSIHASCFQSLFTPSNAALLKGARSPAAFEWKGPAVGARRPGSLELIINRENAPIFVESLSQDIVDYLTALMAPLATGEEMDKEEYFESLSALYGPGVTNEVKNGVLSIHLVVPGQIQSSNRGVVRGERLSWDIPLADILVLEEALTLKIEWH